MRYCFETSVESWGKQNLYKYFFRYSYYFIKVCLRLKETLQINLIKGGCHEKRRKKQFARMLCYVGLALVIGSVMSLWIKWPISSITAIIYGGLLLFMLPSDVFLGSSLDYKTKSLNSTFKKEKLNINGISGQHVLTFFVITIAFIVCLIVSLLVESKPY